MPPAKPKIPKTNPTPATPGRIPGADEMATLIFEVAKENKDAAVLLHLARCIYPARFVEPLEASKARKVEPEKSAMSEIAERLRAQLAIDLGSTK